MKLNKHFFILFIAISCLLIFTIKAFCYVWLDNNGAPVHWPTNSTTMDLQPISFPSGNPYTDNMINAMQSWTNVVGSPFTFNWTFQTRDINNHNDWFNAVAFVSDHCDDWDGATFTRYHSWQLYDTDIWFDVDCTDWVPNNPDVETDINRQVFCSFLGVAQHELGHALHLEHEFNAVSRMNYEVDHNPIFDRLQEDDKNGIRFLYPNTETEVDLSVTNAVDNPGYTGYMRYVNASVPSSVRPGDTISIEYTIENMGTVEEDFVSVGFYLGDYFLGTSYFDFPVHSIGTFTRDLVVPSNIPPGDYPLYVFIDDLNQIAESDEANNRFQNPWGVVHVIANSPPVLNYIGPQSVLAGSTLTFSISGSDPDNDPLTYSATNLPSGATFSGQTFSWSYAYMGTYYATFVITDSNGATDSETVTITVSSNGGRGCFLAGTPILMGDGSVKAIEQIKASDTVMAFDEKTKSLQKDKVVKTFRHKSNRYLIINGNLKLTENHPVYSKEKWIEAGKLKIGDTLVNAQGQEELIISIKEVKKRVTVYNLEVNPHHTYIAVGVVVHNKPPGWGGGYQP